MKKSILLLVYCMALTLSIAQDQADKSVWRVTYMKPKADMRAQFEKGLADHVKKHHPADGWPEYHFQVISGPNVGMYMKFSGPHSWKSFDERVRSQGDRDHTMRYLFPFMETGSNRTSDFWVYSDELSHQPAPWKYAHLSYNYTVPGTGGEYMEFLEEIKKSKEINKSENPHEIYKIVSGENPDTWVWAYPMEKMEDMEASNALGGGGINMEKALGKSETERLNTIYQSVTKSRMREVIKFRPDLSTSADKE